jgi:hypothetical protein
MRPGDGNGRCRDRVGRDMVRTTIVAVAALVLVSCGGGTGSVGTGVRPFDEVQDSPFSFEIDQSGLGRGIFRVTTTEPMICAIVWGEDETFGNFNNSLDMAGTGIVQHDVFLPGAEPGVEYTFVVQGTTSDGTLYRSEVGTFVLPEPDSTAESTDDRTNLALGAEVVSVSSEFSEAFAAGNAVDGDPATEWSSSGDGDGASITLDLGAPAEVSGFEFLTRSMADGSAVTESFTVVVDGTATFGPYPAGNPARPRPADVTVTGRVFTFEVTTSTGGNTGAVEIRILGG